MAELTIACSDELLEQYIQDNHIESIFTVMLSKMIAEQPKDIWTFINAFSATRATAATSPLASSPLARSSSAATPLYRWYLAERTKVANVRQDVAHEQQVDLWAELACHR